jgi:FAD:protein FMN transferase
MPQARWLHRPPTAHAGPSAAAPVAPDASGGSRRRALVCGAAGLLVLPAAARAAADAGPPRHRAARLFGGPVDLLLPAAAPDEAAPRTLALLETLHSRWNAWKPGELDDLNAALRNGHALTVTPALAQLLRRAAQMERDSLGCFNPALGALVGAWGFHADVLRDGPAPDAATLARWRAARPGLSLLRIDGLKVGAASRAVQVDLGGCAKGAALDMALDALQRLGVRDALLNLGGNLAAMGGREGRPWRVGIRDPHGAGLAAWVDVQGREAVVTSGTYERARRAGGQVASHVIDPVTARPAQALASVTVLHRDAALADAAATALLVAGPLRWRRVAARMGVDQVLVIDPQGRREATAALARRLHAAA